MKLRITACVLAALLVITGCTDPSLSPRAEQSLEDQKQSASTSFTEAQNELFDGIDETAVKSADPMQSLKNRLIGEAWNAYYTGDTANLEKLIDENGLRGKIDSLVNKYNLKAQQEILDTPSGVMKADSRKIGSTGFFEGFVTGDVLVCQGGKSSSSAVLIGIVIPGHWKHAGILDRRYPYGWDNPVLSASDATTHGFAVGYESRTKWMEEPSVGVLRVDGRTDAKAVAAVTYGAQFAGKPYSVFTSRTNNNSWYCSKVVYRSWLSQGINLEPTPWFTDPWVTPQDLWDDNNTYFVGGDSW
jgi:hypothetical protein